MPEPFRRRAVEGFARLSYDVAPWGGLGNIHVLTSEPAAAFGEEVKAVLLAAHAPVSSTGAHGCIQPVRFQLGHGMALGSYTMVRAQ